MDCYVVTLSLRKNGVEQHVVHVLVPSEYAWDPQWGVQVPDPEEPGQALDVGGEFLIEAVLRGEHRLVLAEPSR